MYRQREQLHKARRNWLGVSLGVIVLLVFSSCIQFYLSYKHHLEVTDNKLETLSLTLIKQAGAEFRSAELALRFAREKMLREEGVDEWNPDSVYNLFRDVISIFNQSGATDSPHDLFWVNEEGIVKVTSYSDPTPEINVTDRFYFSRHRNETSLDVFYSGAMQSKLTNQWVVYQTLRLEDAEGKFLGVIGITTRTDAFESFYNHLDLNEGTSIVLAHLQGRWSYRFPFNESQSGINFTEEKIFSEIQKYPDGKFLFNNSPYDGEDYRAGFTWSDSKQFVAIVMATTDSVNREFYPILRQRGVLLAAMIIILLIFILAYNRVYQRTDEAMRLATIDELTAIPNRRYFEERFSQEWKSLLRKKESLGVLYIDIDYFKKYNDQYGHAAGDLCLKNVANIIKSSLKRPDDFVARYGGEEFIVLLPGNDYEQTKQVADEVLQNIRDAKFLHIGSSISSYLTVSIGFTSMVPEGDDDGKELIHKADRALYMAKNNNRDQVFGLTEIESARY